MSQGLFIDRPKVTAYGGPPRETEFAGDYMECSDGHKSVYLTRGYDPKKDDYYQEGECREPGCDISLRIYDKERRPNDPID